MDYFEIFQCSKYIPLKSSNSIQIRSIAGVEFQCKLDKSAEITLSAEIQKAEDGNQATSGSGDFQFHASYYTDETFADKVRV